VIEPERLTASEPAWTLNRAETGELPGYYRRLTGFSNQSLKSRIVDIVSKNHGLLLSGIVRLLRDENPGSITSNLSKLIKEEKIKRIKGPKGFFYISKEGL